MPADATPPAPDLEVEDPNQTDGDAELAPPIPPAPVTPPAPVEIEAPAADPVAPAPDPASGLDAPPAPVEAVTQETEPQPQVATADPPTAPEPAVKSAGAKEPADEDEEKPFDPATDLPMDREGMDWFVLRVASNKENYVRETLHRKVQIEGLIDRVGRIMVPTEKTKTLKGGKTKITETKLYPGYIFVEMRLETDGRIPQDVFFLIKETTGVGDFVGTAGRPTPMAPHEVEKMLFDSRRPEETTTVKMEFVPGDYVTITEGPFATYEGTVDEVLPDKGLVRVLVTIFGRQAPVELEYWQIQKAD